MVTRIYKHIRIPYDDDMNTYTHIFDIHTYMLVRTQTHVRTPMHTDRCTHALMHIVTGTCPSQIHNLHILVTVAMEIMSA